MKFFDILKRKLTKKRKIQNKNMLSKVGSQLHKDIENLVWIKNGPKMNYKSGKNSTVSEFYIGGLKYTFKISTESSSEPSAIDIKLPITQDVKKSQVNGLSYYPAYSNLTPDQRALYLQFLSNPYDPSYEIGYVFLLYYGLERFLLEEKFEESFNVINKLRQTHKNGSFQYYSGNALILSCIYNQRPDLMIKFIESTSGEYNLEFSDNLFLLSAYSFKIPLNSWNIIRLSKTFEFNNKRYISKYPDMFNEAMVKIMKERYGEDSILLNNILKKTDFDKLRTEKMRMFANISISEKEIDVPLISESFIIKKTFFDLLEETHETVKVELAELRRKGKAPTPKKKTKANKKTILTFDKEEESILLKELQDNMKNPLDKHFTYMNLYKFYYKFRELDNKYIDECIRYCKKDIKNLDKLQEAYIQSELKNFEEISGIYEGSHIQERHLEIKEGFKGSIPAFKRLAIIYEKQKKYEEALEICDSAIEYYKNLNMNKSIEEFEHRKTRILNKINKN